jgi:serine protease Do
MARQRAFHEQSMIRSYTPGVKSFPRRATWLAAPALVAILVAASAIAETPPSAAPAPVNSQGAARAVANAARQVAEAADEYADNDTAAPESVRAPGDPLEVARQGVVVLERSGKVLGLGTVLNGDGRILTALSPLTHGNHVDARYADGSVTQVRIGHSDRAWDLALLIPKTARWKKGLKASRQPAIEAGSAVRAFSLVSDKSLALARTIVKGQSTLLGGDSELLRDALELGTRFKPTEFGSPMLDDKGEVVAVVARACAPGGGQNCTQVPYGVPVSAVRAFLRTAPAGAVPPAAWLGIQAATAENGPARGVRVVSVHPQSPAAAAGLKPGNATDADLLIAVDGVPVPTPEALAEAVNRRAVGDSVELLVFGQGRYRHLTLVLRAAPNERPKKSLTKPR